MGDIILHCPVCCNKVFNSKKSLVEHLSHVANNLSCPICTIKFPSIENLVQHLSGDNCETTVFVANVQCTDKAGVHESDIQNAVSDEEANDSLVASQNGDLGAEMTSDDVKLTSEVNSGVNKMYVELLSKQLLKPSLETQELKLVMQDGESRYVVLSNNSVQNLTTENTAVPKQNHDGNLSLSTGKGSKSEQDNREDIPETPQAEPEENSTEIYSCNTCGICFSSVVDHIQNYHNDQDVVVEEPLLPSNMDTAPETTEESETYDVPTSTLTLRRMITETGDIVETPLGLNEDPKPTEESTEADTEVPTVKTESAENTGKGKRYVQIGKFCNSVVKNINEDEKGGPYHRVILKELITTTGSKIKIYNCISCNLYVPTIADFKSRPCKKLKYPCPHCPVAYENSKSLCAHMKVHKSKTEAFAAPVSFECTVCSTVFPTSKSLKLHKRMHDPIKSRPIDPPVETKLGTPVSEDKYLCNVCNKLIPVDYRTIHQNSHKSSNKMNCHICNKKFNSRAYLEMHMGVHNIEKMVVGKQDKTLPYNCVYCNRQFARPHEKVKHERIHTGEKPHSCEICGKSFRVSYCLTLHMRTHTGARPYACPHCGKRFKAHSVYNHHLLTHSEVRAYKCPYCPKAFKTSVQLAGHKNSHTKPFSCQQCNRPFASLYAVRVHMDSHAKQNSLKFSCTLCGASYARAFALKDHVRQTHQADMEAADALSGLKEEEWLTQGPEDDEESMESLNGDLNDEIKTLEMNTTDELIVP